MQLLSRVYEKDGTPFKTEILFVTNNSLKKINAPLLVGQAKYNLTKNGSVKLESKDGSRIEYALYGGKYPANPLIDDKTLSVVFGNVIVTQDKVQDAIDKLAFNLEKDVEELTPEQVTFASNLIDQLENFKHAFDAPSVQNG